MSAPCFIALEGIDGSGTTTQCQLLVEELHRRTRREVIKTREPYDAHLTRRIRQWLTEDAPPRHALLLTFALDRQVHLEEVVLPALKRGAIVVTDRYKLSTSAYQRKHNPWALIEAMLDEAPDPDLTLLLRVAPEEAAARIASRSVPPDVYERSIDFQRYVDEAYMAAADHARDGGATVEVVEAKGMSILETHDELTRVVCEHFGF